MKAIFTKDHYILNGTKAWITNAGLADWYFILARTDPDLRSSKAFTGFIVERNFNGLSVGKRVYKRFFIFTFKNLGTKYWTKML